MVSPCTLRTLADGFFVSVLGWDGSNDAQIVASEQPTHYTAPYCPAASTSGDLRPSPRRSLAAALVSFPPGKLQAARSSIIMFGGSLSHERPSRLSTPSLVSSELWKLNTAENRWEFLGNGSEVSSQSWPSARYGHSLTASASGSVYLFGGRDGSKLYSDTWMYTLEQPDSRMSSKKVWTLLSDNNLERAPSPRRMHAAAIFKAEKPKEEYLIITGGIGKMGTTFSQDTKAEAIETPGIDSWAANHVILHDTWQMRLGVEGAQWESLSSYVRGESSTKTKKLQPAARYGHSACAVGSRVYIFGGIHRRADSETAVVPSTGEDMSSSEEDESNTENILRGVGAESAQRNLLSVAADVWVIELGDRAYWSQETAPSLEGPTGRAFHSATIVSNLMIIFGGVSSRGDTLNDVWSYNLDMRSWSQMRPQAEEPKLAHFFGRSRHAAILSGPLYSDLVVIGGDNGSPVPADTRSSNPESTSRPNEVDFVLTIKPRVCSSEKQGPCVPCREGTRYVRASENLSAYARCEACPPGFLSASPNSSSCSPCPPGTASPYEGASSWDACSLCPPGTYTSNLGSPFCRRCKDSPSHGNSSDARARCPAGTSNPYAPNAWRALPGGRGHPASNSSTAVSFLGIESHNYPRASTAHSDTDLKLAEQQAFISRAGLFGFLAFVSLLLFTSLLRPFGVELFLRSCDVPPISGGPGRSRAGGFFTILYVFAYTSFFVSFCLRYFYFNVQMTTSLNPSTNEHFLITAANYYFSVEAVGYAAESCTAPYVLDGDIGPCAVGNSVSVRGIRASVQDSTYPRSGLESVNCIAHKFQASCRIIYACNECHITASEPQARFEFRGPFAYAHFVRWESRVTWSEKEIIPGQSSISATIYPSGGRVLRGAAPSEVTLNLVPTAYENTINLTRSRGFHLQYIATNIGTSIEPEDLTPSNGDDSIIAIVMIRPLAQEYKLEVTRIHSFIELVAQLLAVASGFSFLCRFLLWFYLRTIHPGITKVGRDLVHSSRQTEYAGEGVHPRRSMSRVTRFDRNSTVYRSKSMESTSGRVEKRNLKEYCASYGYERSGCGKEDSEYTASFIPVATAAPWLWNIFTRGANSTRFERLDETDEYGGSQEKADNRQEVAENGTRRADMLDTLRALGNRTNADAHSIVVSSRTAPDACKDSERDSREGEVDFGGTNYSDGERDDSTLSMRVGKDGITPPSMRVGKDGITPPQCRPTPPIHRSTQRNESGERKSILLPDGRCIHPLRGPASSSGRPSLVSEPTSPISRNSKLSPGPDAITPPHGNPHYTVVHGIASPAPLLKAVSKVDAPAVTPADASEAQANQQRWWNVRSPRSSEASR